MKIERMIGRALAVLALAFTLSGCGGEEPQAQKAGETASQSIVTPGFPPNCPRQWFCSDNNKWYTTKALCSSSCPGGVADCTADANCSLPNCTCP